MLFRLFSVLRFVMNQPLTAERKLAALFGFFRWQIGARLLKRQVIVPWVDDSRFILAAGDTGLTGNLYTGFADFEDMLFVLHALRPSETFVDIGANVGAYTILASKVVKSRSIAFEPIPQTVKKLEDQILINGIGDIVDVRPRGVGSKKEMLSFTTNKGTVNRVDRAGGSQSAKIEVVCIDDELDHDTQYVVKIDVEGFEYDVVMGGQSILRNNASALIIELNSSGYDFGHSNEQVHQLLLSLGFIPVRYEPKSRTLTRLTDFNRCGGNGIYVKDVDNIARRCRAATKRVVHTAGGASI